MGEPVADVGRKFGIGDGEVVRVGFVLGLGGHVGPGGFELVAGVDQVEAAGVFLENLQAPPEAAGQAKGAVMIEPAVVEIGGGHGGGDTLQAGRLLRRDEKLCCALVTEAIHADAAVRFGAGEEPGDGFGAIGGFVTEGVEVAIGAAAPAYVLDDDVVAVAGEPCGVRVDDGRGNIAAVGLAHEQRWAGARAKLRGGWVVVVRDERGAVGQATANATFKRHAIAEFQSVGLIHASSFPQGL